MDTQNKKLYFFGLVGLILISLTGRLAFLQLLNQGDFGKESMKNAVKTITETPARGLMYDRNGKVMVDNRPSYTLVITPSSFDKANIEEVANLVGMPFDEIKTALEKIKGTNRFNPAKIKRDLDFKTISYLSENKERLKGVDYQVEALRTYPNNFRASHVFGYAKEISEKQLEKQIGDYYTQGDMIGSDGLEAKYEETLRGEKGYKFMSVDVKGREMGSYNDGNSDIKPVNGSDLVLAIDSDLQEYAEKLMGNKRGGVVAMDPRTGEILCMVSKPDYDLKIFSGPTDSKQFATLINDVDKPLFDRVIQSKYPPGSTWKPMMSMIGFSSGELTPKSTITCEGSFTYGGRTWEDHGAFGPITVVTAIEKSVNVFFYKLGLKCGIDNYNKYASIYNFGKRTGIDLPNETYGLLPSQEYLDKVFGKKGWNQSVMINLGIGQGELLVSPIQLACYCAAISMNGIYSQPHLVQKVKNSMTGEEEALKFDQRKINMSQDWFDVVKKGMFLVVNGTGTARNIKSDEYVLSGKTGTAENSRGQNHSWFIGFAPFDDPRIAICVLGENAGFGNAFAAPIAGSLMVRYLSGNKMDVYKEDTTGGVND